MSVSIPTLSMAGWINSTAEKASYMIGCFIAANYSQSVARYGNIETLQYLIKKHAGKMEDLESALQGAFERVVNATFPNTGTAIVTVEQTDDDDPSIFTISLVCEILENGKTLQIGKLVQYNNSTMVKIAEIANG